MSRHPKRVVITGASSGIGAATAIAFASRGAHLVLAARSEVGLQDIARRCAEAGGVADVHVVDITDAKAVSRFATQAQDLLGGIDVWFSCVGVGVVGRYENVPVEDHRRVVEANLLGHMHDAHAMLPIVLAQDHGIWINMISIGGFLATPYSAAYSASKFGLRGFSEALRAELSKTPSIHVCDVYPTFVDTPAIGHAGNYSGAKLSLPPGSLPPEKVAAIIVGLADTPRNTTAIGAPIIAMKVGQFLTPNLAASILNGFMDVWSERAEPAANTDGSLFNPPASPQGPGGIQRDPNLRRNVKAGALATAAAAAAAACAVCMWRRRRLDQGETE